MDAWTIKTQGETKITADNHGETYTNEELEMIVAFGDEPIKELATTLGRTYFAISTMKAMIAAGKIAAPARRIAASDRPYRGWVEGMGDE